MTDNFTYDAFLSYSSKDRAFVESLRDNLERNFFKLDKKLRGKKEKLHILVDHSDVEGDENIIKHFQSKIKESRHLVIICSEAVSKNPYWVNQEINFFKKDRGTDDQRRIVIINYNLAEPITKLSFPKALVQKNQLPLAVDAADFLPSAKINLLKRHFIDVFQLKILARLLNIGFNELVSRHNRYRRQQRYLTVGGASLLALSIVSVFFFSLRVSNLTIDRDREKSWSALNSWIDDVKTYKDAGLTDYKRSIDSAYKYYKKYPGNKDFISAKKKLDSLLKLK